ncbi:MAG: hypothetical protein ACRDJ2_13540 [Actinomycetota bacterium]
MALRSEDLVYEHPGRVLRFPRERAVARRRRRELIEARRRLALVVAVVVVVAGVLLGGGSGGTAVASKQGAPKAVVLQSGETLWDVASEFAPSGVDPRAYVDALEDLNDITGAPRAGMQLHLPR